MPWLEDEDNEEVTEEQLTHSVANPEMESELINTADIPLGNVINVLEGTPFTLDWYSVLSDGSSEIIPLDPNRPASLQSYRHIKNMEVRVTSPMSTTYDEETNTTRMTMGITTYPGLAPTVGEVATLTGPDGRLITMNVTSVTPMTYMSRAVHECELTMIEVGNGEFYNNLMTKIGEVSLFLVGRLASGLDPIITSTDYTLRVSLDEMLDDLTNDYSRSFYCRRLKTMALETEGGMLLYDADLLSALKYIRPWAHPMEVLWHDVGTGFRGSFWESLISMDYNMLLDVRSTCKWVTPQSISPLGIDPVLRTIENLYLCKSDGVSGLSSASLPVELDEQEGIYSPFSDDSYVLSRDYYDGVESVNELEVLIDTHYAKARLDRTVLESLVTKSYDWPDSFRFYYQPVLMILIKMELCK